jgi:DNA invertase Pin-like site-specific DNA recombinase
MPVDRKDRTTVDAFNPGKVTAPRKGAKKEGGMRLGYVRVSTVEQNADMQRDAMAKAGCHHVYEDHASGKSKDRPELTNLLRAARAGDTVVIWKLDRLGRSLVDLVGIINDLNQRNVAIESLTEKLDTTTPPGRMFIGIMATLAEYERNLMVERTTAGLASARARGRVGGRKVQMTEKDLKAVKAMLKDPAMTIGEVAGRFNVSRGTLYNFLKRMNIDPKGESL